MLSPLQVASQDLVDECLSLIGFAGKDLEQHGLSLHGHQRPEHAKALFQNWLATQSNRGRTFTAEQLDWLHLIKDRIIVDMELTRDDLDDTPFIERGGLGKADKLFGNDLDPLVEELTAELVA
ncbi:hypothetical protein L6R46_11545 [Myxococcota bacterium]|nr:hypothetical protein [Myxococcota bacterium]